MRKTIFSPKHKLIIERLRRARADAKLRQIDVAKRLRTPQSYISRCESGEHRLDVVELEAFSKIYGKPLRFFIS
jgi:transcriptional regulator with XRE-family HTH domain